MDTVYRMVLSLTPSVRVFILVGGFIATRCLPCIAHFYIKKLGGALCQAPKIIAVSDFLFFHSHGPVLVSSNCSKLSYQYQNTYITHLLNLKAF